MTALLLLACSDPGDAPPPADSRSDDAPDGTLDAQPAPFTFELGTHALGAHRPQSTHPIVDRSALEVFVGAQGLRMTVLVPRVHDDVSLPLTALAELESGPLVLGAVERELDPPLVDGDGALAFHDLFLVIAPEIHRDDWARLRVVLTDAHGRQAELRRTVRLVLQ